MAKGYGCSGEAVKKYNHRKYLVRKGRACWINIYKPLSKLDLDKILGY
jgi:hypothetical protein